MPRRFLGGTEDERGRLGGFRAVSVEGKSRSFWRIKAQVTFSRVGEKGHDGVLVSPLPRPGEVARVPLAGAGRVRVERLAAAARPPHPAFGHLLPRWGEGTAIVSPLLGRRAPLPAMVSQRWREGTCDLLPRWGEGTCELSPLPRPGEVARVPLAGAGRVRVERLAAAAGPLIRPSATFSRVGEKGQDVSRRCVTSPEAGRGRSGPACGSRAGEGWVRAG